MTLERPLIQKAGWGRIPFGASKRSVFQSFMMLHERAARGVADGSGSAAETGARYAPGAAARSRRSRSSWGRRAERCVA
jgi:hypothetical protein